MVKNGYLQIIDSACEAVIERPYFSGLLVPVNRRLIFIMSLQAWVGMAFDATGWADASNTLYFPLEGPVFNLPEGYSAIIYGMNVENNRVVGLDPPPGGEIPEPGTMLLAAAGLLALGTARLRRHGSAGPQPHRPE